MVSKSGRTYARRAISRSNTDPHHADPLGTALAGPEKRLAQQCLQAGAISGGTRSLPNAPVPAPKDKLFSGLGKATSYGAISGSSATRMVGLVEGDASPLLSLVFMALVSLDAHYTRVDGKTQKASARAAHDQLKSLQTRLNALEGVEGTERSRMTTEIAADMVRAMETDSQMRQQFLQACELLEDIDREARKAAANTAKVLIHQDHLPQWRASMGTRLDRLQRRLQRREAQARFAGPDWLRERLVGRLRRRIGLLEDRIRMYDLLGEKALQRVYVNLAATQAKQWRDVYLYSSAMATGVPAQVLGAIHAFDPTGMVLTSGALLAGSGLGLVGSIGGIAVNSLDAFRDAPRELKRASRAKAITADQIAALASTQLQMESQHGATLTDHASADATRTALRALERNRVLRYQELHRLTNQAWIRRVKGWVGIPLALTNVVTGGVAIGSAVTAFVAGLAAVQWIGLGLTIVGACVSAVYAGSIVNLIKFNRKRRLAMRVDEAVARLVLAQVGSNGVRSFMAQQHPEPLMIDASRLDQLDLSSRRRKAVLRRLPAIQANPTLPKAKPRFLKANPTLLKANPYLGAVVLAEEWLTAWKSGATAHDHPMLQLPARLGIPDIQMLRIKAMVRQGSSDKAVQEAVQNAFLAAVDLQLKVHDRQHPDAPATPAGTLATPVTATSDAWDGVDDSRYGIITAPRRRSRVADAAADPSKPLQPDDVMQSLDTLLSTGSPDPARRAEDALKVIEVRAWSLVWSVIRDDARPRLSRPGGRWRRSTELMRQWDRESESARTRRVERLRARLATAIQAAAQVQGPSPLIVTPEVVDQVLRAASAQADALGLALPETPPEGALSLTPQVRKHYLDVGGLARRLMH